MLNDLARMEPDLWFMLITRDFDNLKTAMIFAHNMAYDFKDQLTDEEKEVINKYMKVCRRFMYQADPDNPYFGGEIKKNERHGQNVCKTV